MAQPLSNQLVSFTDVQSLGLYLKSGQNHVNSDLIMTKTDALAKYNIDVNAMSPYLSNQCPPRSAFVSNCLDYYMSAPTTLMGFDPTLDDYSEIYYYDCTNNFSYLKVYYNNVDVYFTALSIVSFYTSTNGSYGLYSPMTYY